MKHKILIHRMGSLGDTVVALPCFHRIRAAFPDSEVRVLTNAPVADRAPQLFSVLEGSGLIDGYFEYPVSLRDWRGLWRLGGLIRAWRPDMVVYLVRRTSKLQVLRDAIFLRLCGVTKIIGLPWTKDAREPRQRPDGLVEREAELLARALAPLGAVDPRDPMGWRLNLTEAEQAVSRRMIAGWSGSQKYIVLCVGTKQPVNDWGAANWHAVTRHLLVTYPYRLVFVGTADDYALAEVIGQAQPARCTNLCGTLRVRESAAVIAAASLFIGVDSGPMHLAAALETPLVGIYSQLNPPGMWFPFGEKTRVLYPYAPGSTIDSIAPHEVLTAVESLLPIDASLGKQRAQS
jgi:heptosyltransferase-3